MKPNIKSVNIKSVSALGGTKVINKAGKNLGKIEDFVVDLNTGRIAYAVLSFGAFMATDKLFAIPIKALKLDLEKEVFTLDVYKEQLENAPGFDKSNWPDMADPEWGIKVHSYFGVTPQDENPFNL
ncbi:MAG TPA: PRC-barrel domain-containing protein [Geobacteraceae bacterium]|nr:PRC-barrel domain-containing protein [Geobacteraceae bacterium]